MQLLKFNIMKKFSCDMCGECCRNLPPLKVYDELHDGNRICRYLKGNLCSIYENRPIMCNINKAWEKYFSDKITLEDFYTLNKNACEQLKQAKKLKGL